ncbi:hypothetical protein MYCTH_2308842 [Thermothelomyces thermophilus ATCC 42464]|uniref:Uncharacterized protein n=1 Tax=Thermothelomyces thermophilus (strain ATCC 42464 / BCRC 31852 / DSM 1799) TaxID=573729 RepID=G2QKD3_THET4|nr:uncharacterized protein MYCTH_2308842 [Thermothelomyces thermophilus ATCC 42464]AEO60039.1 hypothetical protein MYCTH_2308842 [Thermothelomyces thermophilus ATCC 42464]
MYSWLNGHLGVEQAHSLWCSRRRGSLYVVKPLQFAGSSQVSVSLESATTPQPGQVRLSLRHMMI